MCQLYEDRFIKSAASDSFSKDKLRECAPDKDHFMLHLVAMGDQETFGPNKNGDGFPKQALEKYSDTFVTKGCFFREHRNRDAKTQGIGSVKAATYNPVMHRTEIIVWGNREKAASEYEDAKAGKPLSFSMSCFPTGTMVKMGNGEEKPIESICVGDEIITHKGNIGTVSHTMNRHYTGSAVELRAYGLAEPIRCTPDHGVWIRPQLLATNPCPVCGGLFKSLLAHLRQQHDAQHVHAYKDYSRYTEGFKRAELIRSGDYARTSLPPRASVKCPHTWYGRLLGLYLAEGSLSIINNTYDSKTKGLRVYQNHRVEFCFNINEVALVEETKDLVEKFTGKRPSSFDYPSSHRTVVRSHSVDLHDWLLLHAGKYSDSKKLSDYVMGWETDVLKTILESWLEGDGHWHKENEVLKGTTVSRALMWQMMEISAKLGTAVYVTSFKSVNKKRAYDITFIGTDIEKLSVSKIPTAWSPMPPVFKSVGHLKYQKEGQISKCAVTRKKPKMCFVENGFIYRRIRKVKPFFIDETVYDLTVPGDHGFMVHGYGVSNCRVPYDTCSCCGHEASSPRDYCEHLKSGSMLQYQPEFKKYAFAINDKPTFFDISVVNKPADRIAHYLEYAFPDEEDHRKAASVGSIITGTQWAEYEGVIIPDNGVNWPVDRMKVLKKLAAAQEYLNDKVLIKEAGHTPKATFARDVAPHAYSEELTLDEVNAFRNLEPGTFFKEMAKRAAVLPFTSFVAYVEGKSVAEVRDMPMVKKALTIHLPGVFDNLMGGPMPDIGNVFDGSGDDACSYDSSNDDVVQGFMDEVEKKFSCKTEPVRSRVIKIITITDGAPAKSASFKKSDDLNLTITDDAKAKALAHSYAIYKVAAMRDIESIHGDQIDEAQYLLVANSGY